jgi:hypothetical protein
MTVQGGQPQGNLKVSFDPFYYVDSFITNL